MKTSKWFNNVEGPVSELLEGLISASKEMLSSSGKNAKQPNLFHLSQSLQSLPVLALFCSSPTLSPSDALSTSHSPSLSLLLSFFSLFLSLYILLNFCLHSCMTLYSVSIFLLAFSHYSFIHSLAH